MSITSAHLNSRSLVSPANALSFRGAWSRRATRNPQSQRPRRASCARTFELASSRGEAAHWRAFSQANGVRSKSLKQAVSQSAQFSKPAAQAFICRRVTRCGSPTSAASRRASYQPVSHNASDSAWSLPSRLACQAPPLVMAGLDVASWALRPAGRKLT
jgi:hypothetical protein